MIGERTAEEIKITIGQPTLRIRKKPWTFGAGFDYRLAKTLKITSTEVLKPQEPTPASGIHR